CSRAVPAAPACSTPSLHDALPISESYTSMFGVQTENTSDTGGGQNVGWIDAGDWMAYASVTIPTSGSYRVEYRVASPSGSRLSRSEEHTSELQSREKLVCRLLLEK